MVRFSTMDKDGTESNVRHIDQKDIVACPYVIMVPEHYRPDGSCKCNDPEEQAMMIREWGYTKTDFGNGGKK